MIYIYCANKVNRSGGESQALTVFTASKKLINHDEVVYVIHRRWDVIIKIMYVINTKDIISQITYAYGDNIHAEAWLHANPLDWITSVACLVGGSRRECRASLNHQIQFIVNLVVLKNHNKTKTRDYCQWKLRFHKRSGARVQNPPPSPTKFVYTVSDWDSPPLRLTLLIQQITSRISLIFPTPYLRAVPLSPYAERYASRYFYLIYNRLCPDNSELRIPNSEL